MNNKMLLMAIALLSSGAAQAADKAGAWLEARAGWDNYSVEGESESGILYGGAFGYDITVGKNAFVGVQAGIVGASTGRCESGLCVNSGRDIEFLARAGANVAENTSVYALAGYADAQLTVKDETSKIGITKGGLRVGAGIEQGFGKQTYTKLEYRYTNLGNFNVFEDVIDAGSRHQVSVSFGVRF
jgi:outer membrane immunogenic protein